MTKEEMMDTIKEFTETTCKEFPEIEKILEEYDNNGLEKQFKGDQLLSIHALVCIAFKKGHHMCKNSLAKETFSVKNELQKKIDTMQSHLDYYESHADDNTPEIVDTVGIFSEENTE